MPKKNEKHLDIDPCDQDVSEEEEAGQNITPKTAAKTTTKTKNSAQKAAEKEAEDKKKGGRVKHHMAGAKAKHRLDKPGRKRGGRVGADHAPLSSAHGSEGGAKTDKGGPFEAPK